MIITKNQTLLWICRGNKQPLSYNEFECGPMTCTGILWDKTIFEPDTHVNVFQALPLPCRHKPLNGGMLKLSYTRDIGLLYISSNLTWAKSWTAAVSGVAPFSGTHPSAAILGFHQAAMTFNRNNPCVGECWIPAPGSWEHGMCIANAMIKEQTKNKVIKRMGPCIKTGSPPQERVCYTYDQTGYILADSPMRNLLESIEEQDEHAEQIPDNPDYDDIDQKEPVEDEYEDIDSVMHAIGRGLEKLNL